MAQLTEGQWSDLRFYVLAVLRRWHWIIAAAILTAGAAGVASLLLPRTYTATATVVIQPIPSQMASDLRTENLLKTIVSKSSLSWVLALATSNTVEALIPPDVLKRLVAAGDPAVPLADRMRVRTEANLIRISTSARSAEQAQELANVWAASFVDLINSFFVIGGESLEILGQQVRDADQRYVEAQRAYERFLSASRSDELDRSISSITTVIDDAQKAAKERYGAYLARVRELDLVLRDAESLRNQMALGQLSGLGSTLFVLSLRARAGGGVSLPVQLQVEQLTALAGGQNIETADLDAWIAELRQQIAGLRAEVERVATGLAGKSPAPEFILTAGQHLGYYKHLRELRQQREVEEGRRRALEKERDVKFETKLALERRLGEQRVASLGSGKLARLAVKAQPPSKPSSPRSLRNVAVGGLVGLSLGFIVALVAAVIGVPLGVAQAGARAVRPA